MTGHVLVVGGGIAGLTAATAFSRRGVVVDLLERKPELSDGGGVGLTLVANAMRALAQIGVATRCVRAGIGADSLAICRPDGSVFVEQPLSRIGGPEWPGATGIRRAVDHGKHFVNEVACVNFRLPPVHFAAMQNPAKTTA